MSRGAATTPYLLAALLAGGCGAREGARAGAEKALPAGAVARVGAEVVSAGTVARVAAARGVTPNAALSLAVSDALFANAARAELAPVVTRSLERAAAARPVLEQLLREAERAGSPTAAELAKIAQERWVDLDRPEAVRTTHAVVMNDVPARAAAARAVADKLLKALIGVKSEAELLEVARAFPGEGFEIRAETLPFVTADARIFERQGGGFVDLPGGFDDDFARGANALTEPGQLSGVVKGKFGYHIIRLEERAAPSVVGEAELGALFGDEVIQRRARRARRELVEKLRAASAIHVERAVDELTAHVKVAP